MSVLDNTWSLSNLMLVHIEQLMVPAKLTLKEHMTHNDSMYRCHPKYSLRFAEVFTIYKYMYKANMSKVYQGHLNFGVKHLNWTTDTVTSLKPNLIPSDRKAEHLRYSQVFLTRNMGILNVRGLMNFQKIVDPFNKSSNSNISLLPLKKNNNTKTLNL